ncbi:MAG: methionine--tRNA ligase subunit beta, partial [Nitrospiraceae bacterium]
TTHAVYWSTMLMALELPLPQTIFAHGWWTVNGEKMSKSRGNVVDPNAIIDEFGTDAFRYFLLREVPFGQDGDFSRAALIGRINTELANDLGNLLNRTLTLIERFSGGKVPEPEPGFGTEVDNVLQHTAHRLKDTVQTYLNNVEFNRALEAIWGLVQQGNQYIDKMAPWVLARKPETRSRLNSVLYNAAETLRFLAIFLYPFMPQTAEEMKRQLGLIVNFSRPLLASDSEITWGGLIPGTEIAKGAPLFPRIDMTKKQGETGMTDKQPPDRSSTQAGTEPPLAGSSALTETRSRVPSPPPSDQITIEDFQKIQLKTAKVLTAERVPRSEKLIKLQVDLGGEQRQIVAGIGKRYEPDQLIGRTIVVVANLKPAKLMGIESQGMVLAAGRGAGDQGEVSGSSVFGLLQQSCYAVALLITGMAWAADQPLPPAITPPHSTQPGSPIDTAIVVRVVAHGAMVLGDSVGGAR